VKVITCTTANRHLIKLPLKPKTPPHTQTSTHSSTVSKGTVLKAPPQQAARGSRLYTINLNLSTMSKSSASQMPTEGEEQEEYPHALILPIDRSGAEASLADLRTLLEEHKQKLAARERKRAQQQPAATATTGTHAPDTPRSIPHTATDIVQSSSNAQAQDQAQSQHQGAVNPPPSGYGILSHAIGPTRKLYATLRRMSTKYEGGGEPTEEEKAELSKAMKQFIRAATPTHPVLEVWDDPKEGMRVCCEMLFRQREG
jgi:hypothetical protein